MRVNRKRVAVAQEDVEMLHAPAPAGMYNWAIGDAQAVQTITFDYTSKAITINW